MSTENVIADLLRIAREDLNAMRLLMPSGNRNAIYMCEQTAEKIIRAILSSEGVHAGIGHALSEMVDKIPDLNPLKTRLRAIERLEGYATSYRYTVTKTGKLKPPSMEEIKAFADTVEGLLLAVAQAFCVDLVGPRAPAGSAEPIR